MSGRRGLRAGQADRRPRRTAVVAAATLALLAGCSSGGLPADGPVGHYPDPSDGGMAALLTGTVEVSDACLTIVDDEGRRWLPLFPGTSGTWDGTSLSHDETAYAHGDPIAIGGARPAHPHRAPLPTSRRAARTTTPGLSTPDPPRPRRPAR